jgi:FMN phosphatase YigB (HAD superfamily)
MAQIKALLLDLGNVTVRWESERMFEGLAAAGQAVDRPQVERFMKEPGGAHYNYERGFIDARAFHAALGRDLGVSLDYAAWERIWNGCFAPNRPMEALMARLRGTIQLWALSNTNKEHLDHLLLNYRVFQLFDGITASHLVGAAKPEPAIYQHAIQGLNLEPEQILYLDDVPAFIEGGSAQGLHTFHYTFNDGQLREALAGLGLDLPPLSGNSTLAC